MDSPLGRLLVKLNWSLRRHVAELQEQEWLQLQVVIFFSQNSRFQDSQMLKSEIANGNIFSSEFGFQDSQSWNQKLHIQMAMFFSRDSRFKLPQILEIMNC